MFVYPVMRHDWVGEDADQTDPCISLTTWVLVCRHGRYSICNLNALHDTFD